MRFRVFTVKPDQFASWVAGQQSPARIGATAGAPAPIVTPFGGTRVGETQAPDVPASPANATLASNGPAYTFPENQAQFDYAKPHTPLPAGLKFTPGLTGNAARGAQVYSSAACIGCHAIAGNPASMGVVGPNLTHFGSRSTIG